LAFRPRRPQLLRIYQHLLRAYGPQHWWPGETRFEVMVGAVLTQNTAWSNVERAIANLKAAGPLSAEALLAIDPAALAAALRPAGYFNLKARRLISLCRFLHASGGEAALLQRDTGELRQALLAVHGIGPETADDMLLYAFARPVFVIDAYTRRLLQRLGWIQGSEDYEELRTGFERALAPDAALYGEYHALIVHHAKAACRVRPRCEDCCLRRECPSRGSFR
jgi:endonuclease-3 related protein